jgi:nitroreductase
MLYKFTVCYHFYIGIQEVVMDIIEALNSRYSVRAFKARAVTKETLVKIFEAAVRAPSWANSQPWEIFLAAGDTLDKLRAANLARFQSGAPRALEMPAPQKWPQHMQVRMDQNMAERLRSLEIDREDKAGRQKLTELNYRFFDAPAVAFLCMERTLTPWSAFDMGAFSQSIMLAARDFGVDSMPAVMMTSYPDLIHEALEIPSEMTILFAVALGYQDEKNPINRFRSARLPVDEVVRFKGI